MLHQGCIYTAPDGRLCASEVVPKTGPVTFAVVQSDSRMQKPSGAGVIYSHTSETFTLARRDANRLSEYDCFNW